MPWMNTKSSSSLMKECKAHDISRILAVACLILLFCVSCAKIPIKDGGLVIGKDTTASMEGLGVASVNSKF